MDFDEQVANIILNKVAQIAQERNLDEEGIKNLTKTVAKAVYMDGTREWAANVVKQLIPKIPEMIKQEKVLRADFEQRLYTRWKKALDLFDATIILTREVGERFIKKYREGEQKEEGALVEALLRIHIRACQTAAAISVLLKSGFARDALARQRTLHELAVVASLLSKHGTTLAERFLLHDIVETCKSAEQYEVKYAGLGYEPPDPENLAQLRAKREELSQRFGKNFISDNGWAAEIIGKAKPTFEDLEKAAKLDHLRPYYRMAGYGVHATSKGMVFDIGSIQSLAGGRRGLLAGASNAGLADPGHGSLLSLNICTSTLLTSRTDVEALVALQTLASFIDEAGQAFLSIHLEQVQEEKSQRARDLKKTNEQSNSSQ